MTLRIHLRALLLFFSVILPFLGSMVGGLISGGCGAGASAPPVSLPAPVTGRITVTSPDDSGAALVAGDEGAVEGGAIVHAVNETQAGSTALRLLSLIPSAHAQTSLPEICSRSFHACIVAEADGSFELEIPASAEDEIGVELLNTSGIVVSDRIRHPVPRNIIRFASPVVDVDLLPSANQLYVLMNTFADPPENGLVTILNIADRQLVSSGLWAGTGPVQMAIDPNFSRAAVVDVHEEFAGIIDLDCADSNCNVFDDLTALGNNRFDVSSPSDVVFDLQADEIIVGTEVADPTLIKFDIATGSFQSIGPSNFPSNIVPVEIRALARKSTISMSANVDPVAFVGFYQLSGVEKPVVGLFDGNSLAFLINPVELPEGADPKDVAFFEGQDKLLVSDNQNNQVLVYNYTIDEAGPSATPAP